MFGKLFDDIDLPPRRETFLVRYPRNAKLFAATILFGFIIFPPALLRGYYVTHKDSMPRLILSLPEESQTSGREDLVHEKSLNDQNDRSVKLTMAPDIRVTEDTAEGSLPRIGDDGSRPWQIYARPFNTADKRPRIAIVLTEMGSSRALTDQAITQTPSVVTLAFSTQIAAIGAWVARARQDGHEVVVQIPVEPFDYPQSDPGPDTLLTNLPNSENLMRLKKALRKASGYIGITTTLSSRFVSDSTKLEPLLQFLRDRGLSILDARVVPRSVVTDMARNEGVPVVAATHHLDADLAPESIAQALQNLEKTARQKGSAVGVAAVTPVMLSQLQPWMDGLPERGIALAPLSVMVQK